MIAPTLVYISRYMAILTLAMLFFDVGGGGAAGGGDDADHAGGDGLFDRDAEEDHDGDEDARSAQAGEAAEKADGQRDEQQRQHVEVHIDNIMRHGSTRLNQKALNTLDREWAGV